MPPGAIPGGFTFNQFSFATTGRSSATTGIHRMPGEGVPPDAVAWFRGIVMSHIEYTANGVLVVAFGLLVSELNYGTAGLVGAFIGHSSKLMPTINEKFPAPNGADHIAVTGLLQLCGITVMIALLLTPYGLMYRRSERS